MSEQITTPLLEWKKRAEDKLIEVYVPEADYLPRETALDLAIKRDALAAQALIDDINSTLDLKAAANVARNKTKTGREESPKVARILTELGYS